MSRSGREQWPPRCSDRAARRLRVEALRGRPWDGRTDSVRPLVWSALLEPGRETSVALTFDAGYHQSGWWANSEYDACLHLSVCHLGDGFDLVQIPDSLELVRRRRSEAPAPAEVAAWARLFFDEVNPERWWWSEPPAGVGDRYRLPNVAHVRLFYDRARMTPIKPTGEVYGLVPFDDGTSPDKVVDGRLGADVR